MLLNHLFENSPRGTLNEFAPAGGGGNRMGGGRIGGGGDDDGAGDDPYKYPQPDHYSRSIDFFGRFEADHFDDEEFDKATGEFRGYWDDQEGRDQIAYFKFDNPRRTGDDDPGMGWYYEPQNESMAEAQTEPEQQQIDANRQAALRREREPGGSEKIDAQLAQQNAQRQEYERTGNFWLKRKDTQEHISDEFVGKAAAVAAAQDLLKQQPDLRGNIVITAYGPGESQGVAESEPVPGKYSGHFYDAVILANGDYQVVKINSKAQDGRTNPLNLKVGAVVPRGLAYQLQYQNDGGMFDELKDVAEGNKEEKIGGRYDPDDFDDMVRRLKQRAQQQEKQHGPVDLERLAQRLRDIEKKQGD